MRAPLRCLLPLALAVALLPSALNAWGARGHRAIGYIAEQHLREEIRYTVRELLDGDSLAEVSTWADEIKSDRAWNFASPWHYVNVDDDENYTTAPKNPAGDAIQAIARFREVLKDRSQPRAKRAEALKFLVHLVGDLHQPLHYGRRSDRGGNDVKVRWFGRESNLHSVWDSGIIDSWDVTSRELAEFVDVPGQDVQREWTKADVRAWANESFAYRQQLYEIGDGDLGYRYAYVHGPFLKQRIAQAGIRLAALLNEALRR